MPGQQKDTGDFLHSAVYWVTVCCPRFVLGTCFSHLFISQQTFIKTWGVGKQFILVIRSERDIWTSFGMALSVRLIGPAWIILWII